MKRITVLLLALSLAAVIVLPVTSAVNNPLSNQVFVADGPTGPVPPMPPCAFALPDRVAEV